MEFADLVMKRRTVRRFEDAPVDRDVLERIARLAQHVPSGGFSQGQRLVVVTEPEQRRRVAETCGEAEYDAEGYGRWISTCAAQFIPCVSEAIYHRRYQEADKLGEGETETEWPTPYWWVDVGMTAMVVMLAAHDAGLAAGFAGPEPDELRRVLELPDEFHPVGVIPVGHPLPDKRSPSLKRGWVPFEEFARWERWSDRRAS